MSPCHLPQNAWREEPLSKQERLYQELHGQLVAGVLQPGEQIAAERKLAEQCGVSYMTARAAVQTLVDQGLLIKRDRVGIYVPLDIRERLDRPRVHVIAGDPAIRYQATFADAVVHRLARRGLFGHLLRVGEAERDLAQAVRVLGDRQTPAIVMMGAHVGERAFGKVMLDHPQLMLIGHDLSAMGLHSVLCEDDAATAQAVALLQAQGHRRIAFIGLDATFPIEQQMRRGYESRMGEEALLWEVPGTGGSLRHRIEKMIGRHLAIGGLPCTAAIVCGSEPARVTCEVFQSFGVAIPGALSLVAMGFASDLGAGPPRIACMDPQLEKQIDYAVACAIHWHAEAAGAKTRRGSKRPGPSMDLLHRVPAKYVPGGSVGPFPPEGRR